MYDVKPTRPGRPIAFTMKLSEDEKQQIIDAAGDAEPSVWARTILLRVAARRLARRK